MRGMIRTPPIPKTMSRTTAKTGEWVLSKKRTRSNIRARLEIAGEVLLFGGRGGPRPCGRCMTAVDQGRRVDVYGRGIPIKYSLSRYTKIV
jgi:hypothetical protein